MKKLTYKTITTAASLTLAAVAFIAFTSSAFKAAVLTFGLLAGIFVLTVKTVYGLKPTNKIQRLSLILMSAAPVYIYASASILGTGQYLVNFAEPFAALLIFLHSYDHVKNTYEKN